MSKQRDGYIFVPDYFIVNGKKIGEQDPGYDELVAKYCEKRIEDQTSNIVEDKNSISDTKSKKKGVTQDESEES